MTESHEDRATVAAMQDAMRLVPAEYGAHPAARGIWIEGYMAGALGVQDHTNGSQ